MIGERIEWPYSIRTLSARVAELRPVYLPPDPSSRTTYLAGRSRSAIGSPIRLPVVRANPYRNAVAGVDHDHRLCPVGVSGAGADRRAEDLVCRLVAAAATRAVPRVLVWDGEGAVGRWRARQPELTTACQGSAVCWVRRC